MVSTPPLDSAVDANGDRLSWTWKAWFNQLFPFLQNMTDYTAASVQTPATGFSITVGNRTSVLTLTPAGVLATGTIIMPASPVDGMPVEVSSTQTITALTVSPNTGQAIKNAPTTMTAGLGFKYYYRQTDTTWYRLH